MRTIKFRKWVTMEDYETGDKSMAMLDNHNLSEWSADDLFYIKDGDALMQYIGYKDKNDVEIYEGDIVLHDDKIHGMGHREVFWRDDYACFGMRDSKRSDWLVPNDTWRKKLEVVGSIYENPELLK